MLCFSPGGGGGAFLRAARRRAGDVVAEYRAHVLFVAAIRGRDQTPVLVGLGQGDAVRGGCYRGVRSQDAERGDDGQRGENDQCRMLYFPALNSVWEILLLVKCGTAGKIGLRSFPAVSGVLQKPEATPLTTKSTFGVLEITLWPMCFRSFLSKMPLPSMSITTSGAVPSTTARNRRDGVSSPTTPQAFGAPIIQVDQISVPAALWLVTAMVLNRFATFWPGPFALVVWLGSTTR